MSVLICPAAAQVPQPETTDSNPRQASASEEILKRLENRYAGRNFSVDFQQESTIETMDITDTASGKAWFKHPGKMRWEYKKPKQHIIVSDGENLWIYRSSDNQVVVGDADNYFGSGKGASFLADFKLIREAFNVIIADKGENSYRLKMTPRRKQIELAAIYLEVNKKNLDIQQVTTENIYGDLTQIYFENLEFKSDMQNDLFEFSIPKGADVLEMEEQ